MEQEVWITNRATGKVVQLTIEGFTNADALNIAKRIHGEFILTGDALQKSRWWDFDIVLDFRTINPPVVYYETISNHVEDLLSTQPIE